MTGSANQRPYSRSAGADAGQRRLMGTGTLLFLVGTTLGARRSWAPDAGTSGNSTSGRPRSLAAAGSSSRA